ncbi:MAG: O-antigen polymerase, partial [Candidatus Paceibacterota bacterium]
DTYFLLISSLLSLISGYYIFALYNKNFRSSPAEVPVIEVNQVLLAKMVVVLSFFSAIGGLLTVYVVGSNLGGMDIYLNRPLMVRQFIVSVQSGDQQVSQLYRLGGYMANIGFLSMVLGGILFANKGKIRLWGIFPFITMLIAQFAVMGRYSFVTGVIFFFVSFILFSYFLSSEQRKMRLLEIFSYSLVSIVTVLALSYVVLKLRSPLADNIIAIVKETGYLYFSGGLSALDNFIASDFHTTYGESSFRTVFKWLARFGIWPEESVFQTHNDFVKVSPTYRINTYTFIQSLYQDFTFYGLIVLTFVWGALTNYSIYKVYNRFTITNVVIASVFIFSLIISFFSFY